MVLFRAMVFVRYFSVGFFMVAGNFLCWPENYCAAFTVADLSNKRTATTATTLPDQRGSFPRRQLQHAISECSRPVIALHTVKEVSLFDVPCLDLPNVVNPSHEGDSAHHESLRHSHEEASRHLNSDDTGCHVDDTESSVKCSRSENREESEVIGPELHRDCGSEDCDDEDRTRQQARLSLVLGDNTRGRYRTNKSSTPKTRKSTTSVGERRVGSATRARGKPLATTILTDALRQKARAAKPAQPSFDDELKQGTTEQLKRTSTHPSGLALHSAVIHDIVDGMLQEQESNISATSFFTSWPPGSMGILGERTTRESPSKYSYCAGATLLTTPKTLVRVMTPRDDVDVANLRLSVFSHVTPLSAQEAQFRSRSCQAMASRRCRGAVGIVATPSCSDHHHATILGSAECSFHEFFGTRLGLQRPQFSLLYVTEVAVKPAARRRGIGRNLLQGLEILARSRSVETLYLHVDVTNAAAIALYEGAGYEKIVEDSSTRGIYREFTKSLHLHPGATKGREHFLLHKHLTTSPTWLDEPEECHNDGHLPLTVSSLGFEIPA